METKELITHVLLTVMAWNIGKLLASWTYPSRRIGILPPESREKAPPSRPDARDAVKGFWTCHKCSNTYLALSMADIEQHICRKVTA